MLSAEITSSLLIIANIILIECLLSLDNAAVLAMLAMKVKAKDRKKLLFIGVFLAYFFRVVALLIAFWLIKVWQLKLIGGLYLIYLGLKPILFAENNKKKRSEEGFFDKLKTKYNITPFVSATIAIGIMDLVFSMDNVFVVVALSDNIYLIWFGVLVSIVSLMFVVRIATKFIEEYPALHKAVLFVVIVLGLKLVIASIDFLFPENIKHLIHSRYVSLGTSFFILLTFVSVVVATRIKRTSNKKIKT